METTFFKQRLYCGMLGLAIGDALGVPAEFKSRLQLDRDPVTDMLSGGAWKQPAGTWSDDTAMALATLDAINKIKDDTTNTELYETIMNNFVAWYQDGKYAACNNRFDIGNTTRDAIDNYIYGHMNVYECGVDGTAYGNGALMRILPTIILEDMDKVDGISSLTHRSEVCNTASKLYVLFIRYLLICKNKQLAYKCFNEALQLHKNKLPEEFSRLTNYEFINMKREYIKSSGYVIDTLEAAIWCFMNTNNYSDCVLKAVNLGEDTDTVGAVAGGIAGIYYGINEDTGIPLKWINKLRDLDTLKKICCIN